MATPVDPRVARTRTTVLDATVALMVERGIHALSIEAISERSGVAKTTVYRHWATREDLIFAAWSTLASEPFVPAPGSLHDQVLEAARWYALRLRTPPISVLLPDLVSLAHRDEGIREIYETILRDRRRAIADLVAAAVVDGHLPPDTDGDLVSEMILGPIANREIVLMTLADDVFVARLVSSVLDAALNELIVRPKQPARPGRPKSSPASARR